jgi:DNA modification methylase
MHLITQQVKAESNYTTTTFPIDDIFDVEFTNRIAKIESYNKHLYRPNSYLHKWWARRCGSIFRLILKHLVNDEASRDYYSPGGLEGKIVFDPMMGGGTTLHEAIRLGANVIGADIDPIPVLQARASLSEISIQTLERNFSFFFSELRKSLSPYFTTACPICGQSTDIKFTLYGLSRKCKCSSVIFMDSKILRHETDGSVITICPQCYRVTKDKCCGNNANSELPPLLDKEDKICSKCGEEYQEDYTLPFYQRYKVMAIVGKCRKHGLFFTEPQIQDINLLTQADMMRDNLYPGPLEDFEIREIGPKSSDLISHGIRSYLDLFSSRQLLYLCRAKELLQSFEPLVKLNLALLVSTSLEFNCMLCGYKGGDKRRPGAVRHVFSHHAYSFPYTSLENNPVYPEKSSGTLLKLFDDRIRKARRWAQLPVERKICQDGTQKISINGEVDFGTEVNSQEHLKEGIRRFMLLHGSSTSIDLKDESVDFVVTDPPYYDNVQYSDLAKFFHVWLKQLLPNDINWSCDLTDAAVEPDKNGNGQYAKVLGAIFKECNRVLRKDNGRLIFTFHHWNPKAWISLTLALMEAEFSLVNFYVVHAENPSSVHIINQKSLTHDTILVLAPKGIITRSWPYPKTIDKTDSHNFCRDCSSALGWMLNTSLRSEEITQMWMKLFTQSQS